jgi:hypothetical protein
MARPQTHLISYHGQRPDHLSCFVSAFVQCPDEKPLSVSVLRLPSLLTSDLSIRPSSPLAKVAAVSIRKVF